MTTLDAFNSLLGNFISELAAVFPEESELTVFSSGWELFSKISPRAGLDMFTEALTPHVDMVAAKDPALFDQHSMHIGGHLDLKTLWAKDISDDTREAIWQYIHTLMLLGTTIQNLPEEMLTNIENVARQCAARVEAGEDIDMASIAAGLVGDLMKTKHELDELDQK